MTPISRAAPILIILAVAFFALADAELFFDWTVSYSRFAPLGVASQVMVINDQFPGPLLNTTTNDVVHINVINNLDEPFLLSWNGVQQRKNSWNDGVQGTNCPIPPSQNWTYSFQVKDQIGSFFYFPSVGLQKAAGGYGPIRINNRDIIPIPFDFPRNDFDVLIGDWFNADYKEMSHDLDRGNPLGSPDGILINGFGPRATRFTFQSGATYRLRISNVGLKTSLNFKIQGHKMLLVETEGSYTLKQYYNSLDIHVGQSYSVLVTADQPANATYDMVACSIFTEPNLYGIANVEYNGSNNISPNLAKIEQCVHTYNESMEQALSIRWDLAVGAARPNPQGSYRYGKINITRTIVLENEIAWIGNGTRYTMNGISFSNPDTPLKLADYFRISGVFDVGTFPDRPEGLDPSIGTPIIDAMYHDFIEIVFQNNRSSIESWHLDGYSFFVVGMDWGRWNDTLRPTYNMVDAVWRSTIQVYPFAWTAILVSLDNLGMWNIRSQDAEKRYLGQEVYMRVRGDDPSVLPSSRDELPIPSNVLKCGKAVSTL